MEVIFYHKSRAYYVDLRALLFDLTFRKLCSHIQIYSARAQTMCSMFKPVLSDSKLPCSCSNFAFAFKFALLVLKLCARTWSQLPAQSVSSCAEESPALGSLLCSRIFCQLSTNRRPATVDQSDHPYFYASLWVRSL